MKKKYLVGIAVIVAAGLGLQVLRPSLENPPITGDLDVPGNVKQILERSCYDCHSNKTNLRWYDQVVPAYWLVAKDVKEGRAAMNFSNWDKLAPAEQQAKLWEAYNQVRAGAMPLSNYTAVHTDAKMSAADMAVLQQYLLSTAKPVKMTAAIDSAADRQFSQWRADSLQRKDIPVALNGIPFDPDYKNWQVVGASERFDNGTMRLILGNPIAIRAIREHHVAPWPQGAILAKVAFAQRVDSDGNISTGEFKQVEFMIKDDRKYASTAGWGFARFRTAAMQPYGKTALFTTECMNCHRPQAQTDFVFTQAINMHL